MPLALRGCDVDQLTGRLDLHRHVRDHELQPLELRDRLAELVSLRGVLDREVDHLLERAGHQRDAGECAARADGGGVDAGPAVAAAANLRRARVKAEPRARGAGGARSSLGRTAMRQLPKRCQKSVRKPGRVQSRPCPR